jgi:hypothetical protein
MTSLAANEKTTRHNGSRLCSWTGPIVKLVKSSIVSTSARASLARISPVTDSSQPAARPWYRLHLSTWLLLIPAVVVVSLLEIPGDEPAGLIFEGSEMVHGFPLTYLRRCRDDWIVVNPLAFAPMSPWHLTEQPRAVWLGDGPEVSDETFSFRPLALAIDLAVATAILLAFCAALEWRRRRRRLFQFTLRELLVATALCAAGSGWWMSQNEKENHFLERVAAIEPHERQSDNPFDARAAICELIPRFPRWFRDLVGDERLLSVRFNRPRLWISWRREIHEHVKNLVEQYPPAVRVDVPSDVTAADWNALSQLSTLELLAVEGAADRGFTRIAKGFPNLRSLRVDGKRAALTDVGLAHIGDLTRLEQLDINGAFTDDMLVHLKYLEHLRSLRLSGGRISRAGLENLADLNELEMLTLENVDVSEEALRSLARLNGLRNLDLECVAPGETGLRYIAAIPNLQRLSVRRTKDNRAALKAFEDAHPGLNITLHISSDDPDAEMPGGSAG